MPENHFRSRMAHDDSYLFTLVGFITVDGAFRTGRFVFPKRAIFKTHFRIIEQLTAVGTQITIPCVMDVMTVHTDHGLDCFYLSFCSGVFIHTMTTLKLTTESCYPSASSHYILNRQDKYPYPFNRIDDPGSVYMTSSRNFCPSCLPR
jgi:hypothetical protein